MHFEQNWKNDKLDGLERGWLENGQLLFERNWKDNRRNGIYRGWRENGNLRSEQNWKDDKLDGLAREWWKNGNLRNEQNYKDDKLDGLAREWWKNGELRNEQNWKGGGKDGYPKNWLENGELLDGHVTAEIRSLELLIDSLEAMRKLEDNKLWVQLVGNHEYIQHLIIDSVEEAIDDINSKILSYGVNQNQITAYRELLDKDLFIENIENKKSIKFVKRMKTEHPNWNSNYKIIYTFHSLYIVNNLVDSSDTPILQEINFSEKAQKEFDKLLANDIFRFLGPSRVSYLNRLFGLDKEYFYVLEKGNQLKIDKERAVERLKEIRNQTKEYIRKSNESNDYYFGRIDKIKQSIEFNKSTKTVKIGNQIWMVDNLNVSTFRNGDPIDEIQDERGWRNSMWFGKPAYCYWGNNSRTDEGYGLKWNTKLYNWFVISDPRGIAPEGWRVPTDEDWAILEKTLAKNAGLKMKYNNGWKSTADYKFGNGNNLSGFSGLPSGCRDHNGQWVPTKWPPDTGYWWSSTTAKEAGEYMDGSIYQGSAWNRVLGYGTNELGRWDSHKGSGLSIRLIKDD